MFRVHKAFVLEAIYEYLLIELIKTALRYQPVNNFSINSKTTCFESYYTYYFSTFRSLGFWASGFLFLFINRIPVVRTPFFFFLQCNENFVFGLFETIRLLSSYIQTYNYLLNRCLIIALRRNKFYIQSYFYLFRCIFEHFQGVYSILL